MKCPHCRTEDMTERINETRSYCNCCGREFATCKGACCQATAPPVRAKEAAGAEVGVVDAQGRWFARDYDY